MQWSHNKHTSKSNVYMNVICHAWNVIVPISRVTHRLPHACICQVLKSSLVLPMTHVSSPHWLHYPMQVPMGNESLVNPDSYHTTRSLCDKHDSVSSLDNRTFRITPQVSYIRVLGFSPKGVNRPLLALPNTHYLDLFIFSF